MGTNFDARRVLAHPIWWLAAALLVANDHLFKGANVLPSALTGKLSDFVGLLVAPAVLAALLGVNRRWGWTGSHVLTGVVFATINLSPVAARTFEGLMAHTPFPWWITVDPTDLVALPMLLVSWRIFGTWARRPIGLRPVLWRFGVSLGAVASLATSPVEEPWRPTCEETGECDSCWDSEDPDVECWETSRETQSFNAVFSLQNNRRQAQVFRVRGLREGVQMDCEMVAENPTAYLHPGLFAPADVWVVAPRRGLALNATTNAECHALFVDGPEMPRGLVFWRDWDFTERRITDSISNASAQDAARQILVSDTPEGVRFEPHSAVFTMGSEEDDLLEPICETPDEGTTLGWSDFPDGQMQEVGQISVGADGCNAIEFFPLGRELGRSLRWYFCAPGVSLPFATEDEVTFGPVTSVSGRPLSGFRLDGPRGSIEVSVGEETPYSDSVAPMPVDGCTHHRDSCGGSVQPLEVVLQTATGTETARAGQQVNLGAREGARGETTVYIYRAQRQTVVDSECAAGDTRSARIESVAVTRIEEEEEDME